MIGHQDAVAKPYDIANHLQEASGMEGEKKQTNCVLKQAKKNPKWLGEKGRVSL